jgi:hypothetical protein
VFGQLRSQVVVADHDVEGATLIDDADVERTKGLDQVVRGRVAESRDADSTYVLQTNTRCPLEFQINALRPRRGQRSKA